MRARVRQASRGEDRDGIGYCFSSGGHRPEPRRVARPGDGGHPTGPHETPREEPGRAGRRFIEGGGRRREARYGVGARHGRVDQGRFGCRAERSAHPAAVDSFSLGHTMITFDASTRDYCTVERQKTSTPLQSLILLNDPQVQNAAEAIASLILKSEIKRDKDRIVALHRRITGRKPSRKALSEMIDYRDTVWEIYAEKTAEMSKIDLEMKSYI